MDPEQTVLQLNLGPRCLSKRLLKHFSGRQKQTTFVLQIVYGQSKNRLNEWPFYTGFTVGYREACQ